MASIIVQKEDTLKKSGKSAPALILNVGREHEPLLTIRSQVLRSAGFHVIEECNTSRVARVAVKKKADLVLLCHTIPVADLEWIAAEISQLQNAPPIALVTSYDGHAVPKGVPRISSTALDLLTDICKLLKEGDFRIHRAEASI